MTEPNIDDAPEHIRKLIEFGATIPLPFRRDPAAHPNAWVATVTINPGILPRMPICGVRRGNGSINCTREPHTDPWHVLAENRRVRAVWRDGH